MGDGWGGGEWQDGCRMTISFTERNIAKGLISHSIKRIPQLNTRILLGHELGTYQEEDRNDQQSHQVTGMERRPGYKLISSGMPTSQYVGENRQRDRE